MLTNLSQRFISFFVVSSFWSVLSHTLAAKGERGEGTHTSNSPPGRGENKKKQNGTNAVHTGPKTQVGHEEGHRLIRGGRRWL